MTSDCQRCGKPERGFDARYRWSTKRFAASRGQAKNGRFCHPCSQDVARGNIRNATRWRRSCCAIALVRVTRGAPTLHRVSRACHLALVTGVPWLSPAGVVHGPRALDILLKSLTARKTGGNNT